MDVSGGHCPTHVAHGGDTTVGGVDRLGPHTQRGHRHPGHSTTGDPMEGGRGAHIHLSTRKPPVP